MRFRNIIRQYFTFSRNERIGLYVLIALILLLVFANQLIFCIEKPGVADREEFDRVVSLLDEKNKSKGNEIKASLFSFDPNTIDSVALDSLLLSDQVKRNLLSYRAKGGKFEYKNDFRKLYGMEDSIYSAVETYILLKSKPHFVAKKTPNQKEIIWQEKEKQKKIELNAATESELKSIQGIGDVLSSRIIKYRNLLGGYYEIEQLKEVYGLTEDAYKKVYPCLQLDTNLVRKININFASRKELIRHPYFNWHEVNAVFKYKSEFGFIDHIQQLKHDNVLNDSIYQQVWPYLRTKNDE